MTVFHNDPSPLRPLSEIKEGEWFILVGRLEYRCRMESPKDSSGSYVQCVEYGPGQAAGERCMDCRCLGIVIPNPKSIETTTTLSW